MTDSPTQLDSRVQVVTPENIAFEYRVAGAFGRITAYLMDLLLRALILLATVFTAYAVLGLAGIPSATLFVMFVTWFVVQWFYGGLFEAFWNGQTPGKRMTGLRTVRTDGRPITALQAILRNVLRTADAMPMWLVPTFITGEPWQLPLPTYLVGLVSMAATRRCQRLGDLASGTMVIAEDRSRFGRVEAPDEPGLRELLETLPASFQPSRSLARTLSHYVGRRRYFGPARRQEIARHVGAVLVERLGLPPDTNHDLLLCALYVRAFLSRDGVTASTLEIAPRTPVPAAPSAPPPVTPSGPPSDATPVGQP